MNFRLSGSSIDLRRIPRTRGIPGLATPSLGFPLGIARVLVEALEPVRPPLRDFDLS